MYKCVIVIIIFEYKRRARCGGGVQGRQSRDGKTLARARYGPLAVVISLVLSTRGGGLRFPSLFPNHKLYTPTRGIRGPLRYGIAVVFGTNPYRNRYDGASCAACVTLCVCSRKD